MAKTSDWTCEEAKLNAPYGWKNLKVVFNQFHDWVITLGCCWMGE